MLNKKFKILRLFRIISILCSVIFLFSLLVDFYEFNYFITYDNNDLPDLIINIIVGIFFIYSAIAFNKDEYELKDKVIIIKSFLTKTKYVNFSEIITDRYYGATHDRGFGASSKMPKTGLSKWPI